MITSRQTLEIAAVESRHLEELAELERRCLSDPWTSGDLRLYLESGAVAAWRLVEPDGEAASAYAIFQLLPGEVELLRLGVVPSGAVADWRAICSSPAWSGWRPAAVPAATSKYAPATARRARSTRASGSASPGAAAPTTPRVKTRCVTCGIRPLHPVEGHPTGCYPDRDSDR
jgi:hypothetical protein